jgi:hypothetical protein
MRGSLIGEKDFQHSIGQGEQAQGGVLEVYQGGKGVSCVFWGKKKILKGKGKCEKEISPYMWKDVCEKDVCKLEHGRKWCVASI